MLAASPRSTGTCMPTPLAMLLIFPAIGVCPGAGGAVRHRRRAGDRAGAERVFAAGLVAMDPEARMHVAIGSSLAVIVFTAISSVRAHHGYGAVLWPAVRGLAPGIMSAGCWARGSPTARDPRAGDRVRRVRALMALQIGISPKVEPEGAGRCRAARLNLGAGTVIGTLSALGGIGGGIMTVPYLAWHSVPLRIAVGTAAACTLPVACRARPATRWPARAADAGVVHRLPLLAGHRRIALASMLTAPLGARLAHRLPVGSCAACSPLLIVAADMLLGGRG
jgi:uncharacterized protein